MPPPARAVVSGFGAAPRGGLPQPGVIRPVSLAPAAPSSGVSPGAYALPSGSFAVVASGAMTTGSAHIITPQDGSGSGGGGGGSGNPGNPTVTVVPTVTYAAPFTGGGTSNTATVTVIAPAVTPGKFVIDSNPLVWLTNVNGKGTPGFTLQGAITNGFSLGSEVTLPGTANQSSHYGFIQMVNATLTVTNKSVGPHVLTTNGFVLDNNPQFNLPTDLGWLSFTSWISRQLNPGDTFSLPAWTKQVNGPNSPVDTPRLYAPFGNVAGVDDPPIEMKINIQFYDWLIYQSGSGLWVGIGKTDTLTVTGDEKLDPATNTWSPVGALTPDGPGEIVTGGPAGPTFVTWTGYLTATDFNPPYAVPYWPRPRP